ncbi:hypothetical protein BH24PSE2_BH24PSE2_01000 [soil metagenome]
MKIDCPRCSTHSEAQPLYTANGHDVDSGQVETWTVLKCHNCRGLVLYQALEGSGHFRGFHPAPAEGH